MSKPTKDRNYYRMLTDTELVTLVRDSSKITELERVLAERLKSAHGLRA